MVHSFLPRLFRKSLLQKPRVTMAPQYRFLDVKECGLCIERHRDMLTEQMGIRSDISWQKGEKLQFGIICVGT